MILHRREFLFRRRLSMSSVTIEQFVNLFTYCDTVSGWKAYTSYIAFLCELKQGLSYDFLKASVISRVGQSFAKILPQNIGFAVITKDNYLNQHVSELSNHLFNPVPDDHKAIVYINVTYCSILRTTNFQVLRHSFCIYKGSYLVKPILIVGPDGYLLSIIDSRNNVAVRLRNTNRY